MKRFQKRNAIVLATMAATFAASSAPSQADDANIIDAFETNFFPAVEKLKTEVVAGKSGQAVQLSFAADAKGVFARGRTKANAAWDKAAGFSFWLKGDGSAHLGGLEFIWNDDYAIRYAYSFPLTDTNWHKVVVAWRDLVPELSTPIKPLDAATGNAPSKLGPIGWGKWWYWGDYGAHSYAIDDLRLEPTIALDTKNYRPQGAPLARVMAKLQAGKPITMVTMGDSLTDFRHWANKVDNWPTLLQSQLKAKFGSEVKIVNPALGGTALRHNLVVLPRWTQPEPAPDLVTIFFGFNDYDGGMRGAEFLKTQSDAIERVRRATKGAADVLVLTTCPPLENGERLGELAEACREAARDQNAGLADVYAAFIATPDRASLHVDDKVHLSAKGHALVAQTLMQAIGNGGQAPDLK